MCLSQATPQGFLNPGLFFRLPISKSICVLEEGRGSSEFVCMDIIFLKAN